MTSMLLLITILCSLKVSSLSAYNSSLDSDWDFYKKMYHKTYGPDENRRRLLWERNVDEINQHNLGYDMGQYSYMKGLNCYSDMDHDEFVKHLYGYETSHRRRKRTFFAMRIPTMVPDLVDWRQKGFVTDVKNQYQCGSCWAFCATGALEAQLMNKTGNLVSLSEQNLVDCSTNEGNHGCKGGSMDLAFEYIINNGGIDTEDSYPYVARDESCHFHSSSVGATCSKYVYVSSGDENDLKVAVALIGPVAAAIDASPYSFQLYKEGIYDDPTCSSTRLNHAVLAVGYGTENGVDYWLVKNSWGTSWGENGYMKISRNKNNQCGIATEATFPII